MTTPAQSKRAVALTSHTALLRPLSHPHLTRSMAVAMPGTAEWALTLEDPLAQCTMLNIHAIVMINVVLPFAFQWEVNRRARRRFAAEQRRAAVDAAAMRGDVMDLDEALHAAQREEAAAAEDAQSDPSKAALLVQLYIMSTGVWSAVCTWAVVQGWL